MNHENDIKGDKDDITYRIKKLIDKDKNFLNYINGNDQYYLNRIGKISYIKHDVVPKENNGKQYYIYCINLFI